MKRRDFLKAAAVVAAPLVVPRHVLSASGQPGANDRIRTGVIGCGSRVTGVIASAPKDIQIVALADCDLRQMGAAGFGAVAKRLFPDTCNKWPRHQDYRQMLAKEKLDAVFIATTTHARALCCIHAVQAGLDVYAEKPLTLTIQEGQAVVRAVRKHKSVFQVGTQAASFPVNRMGSDLVRNGALGKLQKVIVQHWGSARDWPPKAAEPIPAELNWDLWCNQAELVPHDPKLYHGCGRWSNWRAYENALLTGLGTHGYEQAQRGAGVETTGPVEIWPTQPGNRNSPVHMRYANGLLIEMLPAGSKGPDWGAIFVGEKGKIEINRWKVVSNPPELTKDIPHVEPDKHATPPHVQNWVDCMRSRKQPNAYVEAAHRATTLCHLAGIARDIGRRIQWDPEKELIIGDEEAARSIWITRPRRKGYELPEVG